MAIQNSGADLAAFDAGGDQRDALYEALSDPRRRFVLHALQEGDAPVSVDSLVAELVAWDAERPASDRFESTSDAVEASLVHNHLPRMADADLIDYDDAGRTVGLADHVAEVQAHLDITADD